MTEEQLKRWFQEFEILKAQIYAWNICLDYENNNYNIQQKSKKQSLQIGILTKALETLDIEEQSVIRFHLISKKSWDKTYKLYENKWGLQNGRSERTLKRMQRKGLHKILEFIIESELEVYFY